MSGDDCSHTTLEVGVDREMHVARSISERHDGFVRGLVAMTEHGHDLAIIAMNRVHRTPFAVERPHA
jgi:hypothetical protein